MTYLVNDKCIKCKYMDCVEVCPVDCFYEGENMLVINPDECIDCDEYCEENNKITASDFNNLYKAKPNKILLIDVRENEEFSASSIEGSISIPLSHLNQESDLKFIQKESLSKEIFTICKSGKRSEKASRILSRFKIPSRSIEGGIEKVKKIF